MCESSTSDARLILDLGRSPHQGKDENWVTRWLMWRTRPGQPSGIGRTSQDQGFAEGCLEAREGIMGKDSYGAAVRNLDKPDSTHDSERERIYWDPARDS